MSPQAKHSHPGPPSSTAQANPSSRGTLHSEWHWGEAPEQYSWKFPKVRVEKSAWVVLLCKEYAIHEPGKGKGQKQKSPGLPRASGDDPGTVGILADLKVWAGALLIAETQA